MRTKKLNVIHFLIFTIGINAWLQSQNSTLAVHETHKWMEQYHVPAVAMGLLENNQIIDLKVIGEQQSNVPASSNTVFSVASLTKPVFSMFILKLVNDSLWKMDEPWSNYWD